MIDVTPSCKLKLYGHIEPNSSAQLYVSVSFPVWAHTLSYVFRKRELWTRQPRAGVAACWA